MNITDPPRSWIMCKNIYQPDGRQDNVFVDYVTLTLHEFRRFYHDIYSSWISWIYRDKHGTFCLFYKMVINKTILMAKSSSNRSCPYESNASIDCWLKTTSHYDVIAPFQPPRMLNCYQVQTCAILWCFVMWQDHSARGSVKHFGDPPVLVEPSRLRT